VDARMQDIVEIVNRDYRQKLSLQQLSEVVGLSSSRLRHKFKCDQASRQLPISARFECD